MGVTGFFERDGDRLTPTARAGGTWHPDKVHGRLLVGVAARAVDRLSRSLDLRCARLTVDLLQASPMEPISVDVVVLRRTSRSAAVEVALRVGEVTSTQASAVLVGATEPPPGAVWSAGPWSAPPPDEVAPISDDQRRLLPWDARPVHGPELVTAERKAVWINDPIALVAGEDASPFVRLATVADAVNPIANSGTRGLRYINTDLTLYLAREPVGEWFGFEVADHLAASGVAVGECRVHDAIGPLGIGAAVGLGMRRPARTRSRSSA